MLPFNVTFITGNCNSNFSTNFYNKVEEIMNSQCMNRVLPTVLEPGDKSQFKKVVEWRNNIK